jgi:hypothetical protein
MALSISQLFIKQIAQLKSRVISSIEELLLRFINGCPINDELQNIIIIKNQLVTSINQLENTINQIDLLTTPIENSLPIIENSINVIKLLPIPTSPLPISVGFITTFSDILTLLKQNIQQFKGQISSFTTIKNYINNTLILLSTNLQILDNLILTCAIEQNLDTNNLLNQLDSSLIQNIQQNIQQNNIDSYNSYKGFTFEIKYDEGNKIDVPLRYAVALNSRGNVVFLRGESSYSSRVDVLINELKFIIDRDNLKA